MSANVTATKPFNPLSQDGLLRDRTGAKVIFNLADLDAAISENVQYQLFYGVQIGAAAMMIAFMFLLSPGQKRKTLMFWLNFTALMLLMFRSVMAVLYQFSVYFKAYYLTGVGDIGEIPIPSRIIPILETLSPCLLYPTIQISLILQVRTMFQIGNIKQRWIRLITGALSLLMLATAVLWVVFAVYQILFILDPNSREFGPTKVILAGRILFAVSILISSTILFVKLGILIYQFRVLKSGTLRGYQILAIGSLQTMLIPAIFSIMDLASHQKWLGIASLTAGTATLLLPISSVWATATIGGKTLSLRALFTKASYDSDDTPSQTSSHSHFGIASEKTLPYTSSPSESFGSLFKPGQPAVVFGTPGFATPPPLQTMPSELPRMPKTPAELPGMGHAVRRSDETLTYVPGNGRKRSYWCP